MSGGRAKPIPDFSHEIEWFEEIDRRYEIDSDWGSLCDEWTDQVSAKLYIWKPRYASQFLRISIFESAGESFELEGTNKDEQKHVEFHQRRTKLDAMLAQRRNLMSRVSRLWGGD
jgi:hypothetical protein